MSTYPIQRPNLSYSCPSKTKVHSCFLKSRVPSSPPSNVQVRFVYLIIICFHCIVIYCCLLHIVIYLYLYNIRKFHGAFAGRTTVEDVNARLEMADRHLNAALYEGQQQVWFKSIRSWVFNLFSKPPPPV